MMYNPKFSGPSPNAFPLPPPPPASFVPSTPSNPFWQRPKLQSHLARLLENVAILKSIGDELEVVQALDRSYSGSNSGSTLANTPDNENSEAEQTSNDDLSRGQDSARSGPAKAILYKTLQENVNYWPESVSLSTQAAHQLLGVIRAQLVPLQEVLDGSAGHEKVLAAKGLANKRMKLTRNRKWRSRKRQRVAEALRKEREQYDTADREADEWRAREIAKVIARRKMEKMKELAEETSKEEKARRQEETEMVLIIETLQELRALRILKLKKQVRGEETAGRRQDGGVGEWTELWTRES